MAELGDRRVVCVLFATIAMLHVAVTLRPGYDERTLDEPGICSPSGHKAKTYELANNRNGSVIVRHSHLYTKWQRDCQFIFKARKGGGLIAAIQNMYLRTDDSTCVDFIRFMRKDRTSLVLCGEIDRSRNIFNTIKLNGDSGKVTENQSENIGEFDSEGWIETKIHLSPDRLSANERLDLTIVYTPYEDCRKIKSQRDDYREISVSGTSSICMWKDYFCDGYQNCVPVLCQDEEDCPAPKDVVSDGTGTKVTIGAVTTMLLCFIIFLMGLLICKRHKKLCWSSDCAGPNLDEGRSSRGDRAPTEVASPSVAVSPMLEVAVLPSVLDKDSPPSYESLFPEHANNPSTT